MPTISVGKLFIAAIPGTALTIPYMALEQHRPTPSRTAQSGSKDICVGGAPTQSDTACGAESQGPHHRRRTTRHSGYASSLKISKRIEEDFGWLKAGDGLRQIKLIGPAKLSAQSLGLLVLQPNSGGQPIRLVAGIALIRRVMPKKLRKAQNAAKITCFKSF